MQAQTADSFNAFSASIVVPVPVDWLTNGSTEVPLSNRFPPPKMRS